MSDDEYREEAVSRCAAVGLSPKIKPLGEDHHSFAKMDEADEQMGAALAYVLGTLFADQAENENYWRGERTSRDEWSRVARALRIHGLKIVDAKTGETVE